MKHVAQTYKLRELLKVPSICYPQIATICVSGCYPPPHPTQFADNQLITSTFHSLLGVAVRYVCLCNPYQRHTELVSVSPHYLQEIAGWFVSVVERQARKDDDVCFIVHYAGLSSLIEKCNQTFSGDSRIKFYFKAVERLGGRNDARIEPLYENEKAGIKSFLDSQVQNPQQVVTAYNADQPYVCYAAKPNSLMIRANGRIGKCTVALNDQRNDIGTINPAGELLINDKLQLWLAGLETMNLQTLACPFSKLNEQQTMNNK